MALLVALLLPLAAAAKTAKITGVIFTIGADHIQTVWPQVRVTLKNLATGHEFSAVSNDVGGYAFNGVLPGEYEITCKVAGFDAVVKRLTLRAGDAAVQDFQLSLAKDLESVTVTDQPSGVDLSSSSGGSPTLNAQLLKSVIRLNQDFQDALPLVPGVVRGPDGLIRIKGGRANQSSTLVNAASVADPFTGQPALKLPAVAVQSMRVLSNPFSAEYGRFASGVVEVTTRGGTDEWKWLFEDPIPRFRWINGSMHGVESASPHLTVAGPIKRGKLYLFQSLLYGYDTIRVPSLPDPDNVHVEETATTYTQLDWNLSANQHVTAMMTVDPRNTDFANIDTFNPQPVTSDYRQRSFFTSATHRWILANGGYVESLFSARRLDWQAFPANKVDGGMVLFPEQNYGSFFEEQSRRTRLYQFSQTMHLWPIGWKGRHLLAFGYSYARSTYQGGVGNLPVSVLREDKTLSSSITYDAPLSSLASKDDISFFVQDNWQIHPRFSLDLGVRADRDSLSSENVNVAPRIGFVFAPTRDDRTAIRGGFGVFFDKIPLNVAVFRNFPAQRITRYAADGTTVLNEPATFTHVLASPDAGLRVPYSLGWTLQFDRQVNRGLLFRFGYEHREGYRDFYVNPVQMADGRAQLQLFNSGRQSYREFLSMLRWRPVERTTVYASFVHSRAEGDLNDYNQFFGMVPSPLIRQNQRGPLVSDAPNRALFWGVVGLPRKLEFVPVLDVHSGFPYSKVDQNWDFIGRRNQAGRFPTFIGLDAKIQYPFDFKFRRRRFQFTAGLSVTNVLNYYNPRDVQQNVSSPNFGNFYNSVGRRWRIDGGFDF